ncbi:MAG: thioredoxin [Sodaliphilus sp.]|nr:thioredoxin [Sodaliphilus sp.]
MIKKLLLIVAIVFIGLSACSQNKDKTRTKATKAKTEKTTTAATDTATGKVIFLTTAEFKKKVIDFEKHPNEWVFEGKKPAIIDFFATWCGPCRRMSPTVDKIAKDYAGKIDVYKIDIDKEKQLAMVFGIQSVPTILFVPVTGKPTMQEGALDEASFRQAIREVLFPTCSTQ